MQEVGDQRGYSSRVRAPVVVVTPVQGDTGGFLGRLLRGDGALMMRATQRGEMVKEGGWLQLLDLERTQTSQKQESRCQVKRCLSVNRKEGRRASGREEVKAMWQKTEGQSCVANDRKGAIEKGRCSVFWGEEAGR